MSLDNSQKKRFRQIGHHLKPIVTVTDKGVSAGVSEELERALTDHELIKVKLAGADREQKQVLADKICKQSGALCIQTIGHVLLLYRKANEPNPKLSNLVRFERR